MGEIIRFFSKSERERDRLIREAHGIYDNIFPAADPVGAKQNKAPVIHTVSGAVCTENLSSSVVVVKPCAVERHGS
jgi:hypothetical protein